MSQKFRSVSFVVGQTNRGVPRQENAPVLLALRWCGQAPREAETVLYRTVTGNPHTRMGAMTRRPPNCQSSTVHMVVPPRGALSYLPVLQPEQTNLVCGQPSACRYQDHAFQPAGPPDCSFCSLSAGDRAIPQFMVSARDWRGVQLRSILWSCSTLTRTPTLRLLGGLLDLALGLGLGPPFQGRAGPQDRGSFVVLAAPTDRDIGKSVPSH